MLNFASTQRSKRPLHYLFALSTTAVVIGLSSTLATNININTGPIEFGQGLVQTTSCDPEVTLTPISTFVNGTPGEFEFTSITLSGLDSTSSVEGSLHGCQGKSFTIKAYKENGDLNLYEYVITVGLDSFLSSNGSITSLNPGSENSSVTLTFTAPRIAASDVYRITIETTPSIDVDCTNSQLHPAISAAAIKLACPSALNGLYWIYLNGVDGTAEQVYSIMDSSVAGGGWMLVMKDLADSGQFAYGSEYWDAPGGLHETNIGPLISQYQPGTGVISFNEAAKYNLFDQFPANEILALFPGVHGYAGGAINGSPYGFIWKESVITSQPMSEDFQLGTGGGCPTSATALLNLFTSANRCVIRYVENTYNSSESPYSVIGDGVFSSQSDIKFFGFNYVGGNYHFARFGLGWNENGAHEENSNDIQGGIGASGLSAGDVVDCCETTYGLSRSMDFELFVR